ncbi:MAG: hypothetical protein H6658_02055 [Ardenticatenaceae bacterium]|nr:hypothetical protein [Ardenticatenaceae bacterium]
MAFVELSTGHIYKPLDGLTVPGLFEQTDLLADVTRWMWPSYRRTAVADGGDAMASFTMQGPDVFLEYVLEQWLGGHFEETYIGRTTFMGRINTLRLSYNNTVMIYTLDTVFNRIACYYTSIVTGQTELTDFYDDAASQQQWGIRALLIRPSDYIDLAEAEAKAQQVLAEVAQPRQVTGWISRPTGAAAAVGTLQVNIEGYGMTLESSLHYEPSPGEDDASDEVAFALTGNNPAPSFITIGTIDTNTKQVTITSDYRSRLQRIKWIAEQRDGDGNRYRWGCFRGRTFTYKKVTLPVEREDLTYDVVIKGNRRIHRESGRSVYVPAPLLQPGGFSYALDGTGGKPPARPIHQDGRCQYDVAVEYSASGGVLRGAGFDVNERAHAIEMAILGQRKF